MKIAVTGGAGQLGTTLLRRLAAERAVKELISIDLRPPLLASAKLRHVERDIRDPRLAEALAGCDRVVHLAFVVTGHPPRQVFDEINVRGSENLFRAAAAAGVQQVVYTSSIAAYGVVAGHPEPIVETTPRVHQRHFAYSCAKYEVEQFLDQFAAPYKVVRLRPAIFVGAGIEHPMARLLRRRLLVDFGDTPLPLVWDEDVVEAIVLAIKKDAEGAFNLAADEPRSAAELARACGLGLIKVPPSVAIGAGQLLPILAKLGVVESIDPAWTRVANIRMIIDSGKARRELGWRPICPTATEVVQRFIATVPLGLDPRLRVFFAGLRLFGPRGPQLEEARHLSAQIHLRLTGPNGGDVGITIADGRLSLRRTPPRPPTVTVTLKADTLLDMLAGKLDFGTAQLTNKVRVEGEALAALVVQGMVAIFRAQTQLPGLAGALPRRMQQWFARKGAVV